MTSIRPGVGAVGRVISSSGESSFKSLGFIGEEGLAEGKKADGERGVNYSLPVEFISYFFGYFRPLRGHPRMRVRDMPRGATSRLDTCHLVDMITL
jgi:hypothetical protein